MRTVAFGLDVLPIPAIVEGFTDSSTSSDMRSHTWLRLLSQAATADVPIMHADCTSILQQLECGVLAYMLSQQAPALHCSQPPNMRAECRCE